MVRHSGIKVKCLLQNLPEELQVTNAKMPLCFLNIFRTDLGGDRDGGHIRNKHWPELEAVIIIYKESMSVKHAG